MACYNPMKAIITGVTPTGKKALQFVRPLQDISMIPEDKIITVPCGQCIGCRLDYSRQWANRCMMEAQAHEENWFITLTYDDVHVPIVGKADYSTGELVDPVMTLVKRDFQLWMKRLRKYSGQELRFYACGEYGSKTMRPHYHAIIFGLHLDDLKVYKKNFRGDILYNSPFLESTWKNGFVVAADVTWETCAYTARYVMKKAKGFDKKVYQDLGIEPEFVLMSRKPGIARNYYDQNKDKIYDTDRIYLSDPHRGLSFRPPRYFDLLFDVDDPEKMESVREARRTMAAAFEAASEKATDLDPYAYKDIQRQKAEKRLKGLVRDL